MNEILTNDLAQRFNEAAAADDYPSADDPAVTSATQRLFDEIIGLGDDFDFEGFQVVRREFFAHTYEPSVTFNNGKFYVNASLLSRFPEVDYVQVLVNRASKLLVLRPCMENARDSFMWHTKGKRKPRQITCKIFFGMVASMMEWNLSYRYKILGRIIHANGEYLIAFDLTAAEVYEKTIVEGEEPKMSRTAKFNENWKDQFGLPFNEHRQSMQVNIFEGYAIYSITENAPKKATDSAASYAAGGDS